jgi:HD superfamily phosphohydrolase
MEFHDVLHGLIKIVDDDISPLVQDLLKCTEIQRLRNMRQMNFDSPIIQELGRSRRLPHSIGVAFVALKMAQDSKLSLKKTKELVAASLLHDAAIPPYGHLVEAELNQRTEEGFKHAQIINNLINGTLGNKNKYLEILPGRTSEVLDVFSRHNIEADSVIKLISPLKNQQSPIAADIDIDNLDNVHRMAIMLGWDGVRENLKNIIAHSRITETGQLQFSDKCHPYLQKWLEYRQAIYTLIIAHPDCIPQNALQSDLVELAVDSEVITKENWFLTEPIFEEKLRENGETKELAWQLINGSTYNLVNYIWLKDLEITPKLKNRHIKKHLMSIAKKLGDNYSLFIWYEKGLIGREINWVDFEGRKHTTGKTTHSCMIALIKTTDGGSLNQKEITEWQISTKRSFIELIGNENFIIEYPKDYTGNYNNGGLVSGTLF